jgi:hypothetical protein
MNGAVPMTRRIVHLMVLAAAGFSFGWLLVNHPTAVAVWVGASVVFGLGWAMRAALHRPENESTQGHNGCDTAFRQMAVVIIDQQHQLTAQGAYIVELETKLQRFDQEAGVS